MRSSSPPPEATHSQQNGHASAPEARRLSGSSANSLATYAGDYGQHPTGAIPITLPPRGGHENEGGFNVKEWIGLLLRRYKIFVATLLIIALGGTFMTLRQKKIYASSATVLTKRSKSAAPTGDLPSIDTSLASAGRSLETQIEVLKSAPVQDGAVKKLPPEQQSAIGKYYDITVSSVRDTDVMSVSVRTTSPEAAKNMTQAVCDEYLARNLTENSLQNQNTTDFVRGQLNDARTNLDRAQVKLRDYQRKAGSVDAPTESTTKITSVAAIQATLNAARTDRDAAQSRLRTYKSQLARLQPEVTHPGTIAETPERRALREQLLQLQSDRAIKAKIFRPGSPELRDLDRQIAAVSASMEQQQKREVSIYNTTPNPLYESLTAQIAGTQADITSGEAKIRDLQVQYEQANKDLKKTPNIQYQLAKLQSEVAAQQQTVQTLNEKYQGLLIAGKNIPLDARILSPAASATLVAPQKLRGILTFLVLGVVMGLVVATLIDRLDDHVHSDSDVENATGLPTLAHVPFIKDERTRALVHSHRQPSALLEAYRMLRANIAFSSLDEPLRSVVITSSEPGEGKSLSAANLAVTMALSGKRVILLDTDLRLPNVHRQLNLANRIGFTSVVAGQATLEEAIQNTSVPNLRAITSGPLPPNPPELLDSRAARSCFQKIVEACDFVVVDAPPALALVDAQIVASMADGTLLVVSSREAGRNELARVSALLAQTGTKLVGTIVNKIATELNGYYGPSGYGYGASLGRYAKYISVTSPDDTTTALEDGNQSSSAENGSAYRSLPVETTDKKR